MNQRSSLKFWKRDRARRFAAVCGAALIAMILWAAFYGPKDGLVSRGDFPAFYTAAKAVAEGNAARLYDQDLQASLQNRLFPEMRGRYLSFAYPPFVALVLYPLNFFSPHAAKLFFIALQIACAALTLLLLMRLSPQLKERWLEAAVLFASFGPLFSAVLGGQNTALSMLLMVSTASLLMRRSARDDVLAGVLLALWLFKPQLCFLIAAALLIRPGRKLAFFSFAVTAVLLISGSGVMLGWGTWISWLSNAGWFAEADSLVNGRLMVSLPSVLSEPFRNGPLHTVTLVLGAAAAAALAFYALRRYRAAASAAAHFEFIELLLVGAAGVLCAPHALYYDLALFLPAAALLWHPSSDREAWLLLSAQAAVFVFCALKDIFFVQPLGLLAPFCLLFLYRRAGQDTGGFV